MQQNYRLLILAGIVVAGAGFFQNCSQVAFDQTPANPNALSSSGTPNPNPSPSPGQTCTATILDNMTTPVKLLFVVDTSGSNVNTDPTKSVRGGSIQAFVNQYLPKGNYSFGMITFSSNLAPSLINGFSNSQSVVDGAISTFMNMADKGDTPYVSAMTAADNAIASDPGASDTKYIVVFLSDGVPNPMVDTPTLSSMVTNIIGLKPGQMTFNTVFYGPPDPAASSRLSAMAQAGGGQYYDANTNPAGTAFAVKNIVNVPGMVCSP